ncbi:MAG: hypothetical protein H7138_21605, partial [Myxococcales bacterium]|nr:hypothetical protein [Myxococcales bacterium]
MGSLRVVSRLGFALAVACAGCGGGGGGGDDGSGDDDSVSSLTIAPEAATVALSPTGTGGYLATQPFIVTAHHADGTTSDVTATADWFVEDNHVTVVRGTATITAAGPYTVTAQLAGKSAPAQLTATLADTNFGTGFDPMDGPKLDGAPDGAQVPSIAYPIAGALFPVNVAPIEVHIQKSDPAQRLARIELTSGALLTYKFYARCAASPNPAKFANACLISLGGAFAAQLAGVSEADDVRLTVRLAAEDGTKLGEAVPIALAWSKVALTGGLYYWTTAGTGDTTFNTAIARYDFNGDASAPTIYLSSADAPKVPDGQPQCIGCHAVSPDGAKLAFSLGGSTPGFFSLFDVATTQPTQSKLTDKFAGMATFSPDGSRMVSMAYGKLTLRTADATLGVVQDELFAGVGEKVSHPFWSPAGGKLTFVSWTPSAADISAGQITGDMVQGGQVWIADSDGRAMQGAPRLLVPRAPGVTSYYPAISDDERFVVFNQSRCAGPANTPGWGAGACDGYNDVSAALQVVPVAGGPAIPLTRANGGDAPLT